MIKTTLKTSEDKFTLVLSVVFRETFNYLDTDRDGLIENTQIINVFQGKLVIFTRLHSSSLVYTRLHSFTLVFTRLHSIYTRLHSFTLDLHSPSLV